MAQNREHACARLTQQYYRAAIRFSLQRGARPLVSIRPIALIFCDLNHTPNFLAKSVLWRFDGAIDNRLIHFKYCDTAFRTRTVLADT